MLEMFVSFYFVLLDLKKCYNDAIKTKDSVL